MAKHRSTPAFRHSLATAHESATHLSATPDVPTEGNPLPLTKKTTALVEEMRKEFTGFTSDFQIIATNRAELAPRFMRAFTSWTKETGGSFVGWVRLLVPTLPAERADYRNHPTYQAALYLQSRTLQAEKKPKLGRPKTKPVTPLHALARLVVTVLPLMGNHEQIWTAFVKQLHWSDTMVTKFQGIVEHEKSLTLELKSIPRLNKKAA